jgi:hypothetical protein
MAATEQAHAWQMRTVGVDLAAQPGYTGVAAIDWNERGAEVTHLWAGLEGSGGDTSAWESADTEIIRLASTAAIVSIDVPFGWPITFQRFLTGVPNPLAERVPRWASCPFQVIPTGVGCCSSGALICSSASTPTSASGPWQ